MDRQPTVFVVDDDPGVRNSLQTLLASIQLPVESFDSAEHFLAGVDPERSGCIVLDLRMPGITGMELQAELGKRGDSIPIIFISAYGNLPIAEQALRAGAFHFLEKPFRPAEMIETIQRALAFDTEQRRASPQAS